MKHLPCSEIHPLLEAYIDGDLTWRQKSRVRAHLKRCPECSRQIQEEEWIIKNIKTLPGMPFPEKIMERVNAATIGKQRTRKTDHFHGLLRWQTVTVGVAMASIVLLLLFYQGENGTLESVTPEQMAKAERQTYMSLAYVGQMLNRTNNKAVRDVLVNDLPEGIRKSIENTIPLFGGGEQ
jgi:predicted anti-sigma-YlaC factor YlaD